MEKLLNSIKERLLRGIYANEQSVSQGIVIPVLRELGWDDFDPSIVYPEFSLQGMSVDFALCPEGNKKPAIIIEVKRVGNLGAADEQLFKYAFHAGAGIAILTDGKEWHFYFPMTIGEYNEKLFYKLDLVETDVEEVTNGFKRYLGFQTVKQGRYYANAQKDLDSLRKKKTLQENLPLAWQKLIDEENADLIRVLSERVADACNFSPDRDMVIDFLKKLNQPEIEVREIMGEPFRTTKKTLEGDFAIQKNGVNATGYPVGNQFVVRKGATFNNTITTGCPTLIKEEREDLIRNGTFEKQANGYLLVSDHTFSSPSKAASVLMGQAASGPREWIGGKGRSLGSYLK